MCAATILTPSGLKWGQLASHKSQKWQHFVALMTLLLKRSLDPFSAFSACLSHAGNTTVTYYLQSQILFLSPSSLFFMPTLFVSAILKFMPIDLLSKVSFSKIIMPCTLWDVRIHLVAILWYKPSVIQYGISWTEWRDTLLTFLFQADKDWRFPKM